MTTDETIAAAQSALAGKRLSVGTQLLGAADQPTNETPIGRYIDHTLLKPEATSAQIAQLCAEAHSHQFMSVCINPGFLREAAAALAGSAVRLCTVIGFPLGATSTEAKVAEAEQALRDGAHELDMVIAIGRMKAGDYELVSADIAAVVAASHAGGALCKVIIETALLSDEEKAIACLIAAQAGADFVKTSTGFSGGGATVADIALMRAVVGAEVGVKASGGVRSRSDAEAMIAAGATRIGTSAGIAIVAGQAAQRGAY